MNMLWLANTLFPALGCLNLFNSVGIEYLSYFSPVYSILQIWKVCFKNHEKTNPASTAMPARILTGTKNVNMLWLLHPF